MASPGRAGTTSSAVLTHSAGIETPRRRALSRLTERLILVVARNGICAGSLPRITSATSRPASRPFSAKSEPTPSIAPRFTCDGENVKSGIFAVSHARAIAGNDALLRLSEIWQTTSIPDWQRVSAASLTSVGPLTGTLTSSSPSLLSGPLEPLSGEDGVDLPGREEGADPAGLRQDFADRPGHRGVGVREVGPGHVRPVVLIRLSRPGGDRVEHAGEDDRLAVDLPQRGLQTPAWRC